MQIDAIVKQWQKQTRFDIKKPDGDQFSPDVFRIPEVEVAEDEYGASNILGLKSTVQFVPSGSAMRMQKC